MFNCPRMRGEAQNQRAENRGERGFVTPPANISATGNEYVVELDMPGVDREGLEITVEGNELTIIGRRKIDLPDGEACYCESPQAALPAPLRAGPRRGHFENQRRDGPGGFETESRCRDTSTTKRFARSSASSFCAMTAASTTRDADHYATDG